LWHGQTTSILPTLQTCRRSPQAALGQSLLGQKLFTLLQLGEVAAEDLAAPVHLEQQQAVEVAVDQAAGVL
jgi:hypothetical protein